MKKKYVIDLGIDGFTEMEIREAIDEHNGLVAFCGSNNCLIVNPITEYQGVVDWKKESWKDFPKDKMVGEVEGWLGKHELDCNVFTYATFVRGQRQETS